MKQFLAEFWLWILIPAVLVTLALAALLMLGGGEGDSPFVYNVF